MLAPNTVLWASTLLALSFTPYLMKTLNYSPLMALAVAIAAVGILTDGATTLVLRGMNGKEMNPLMNLLFRRLGFRSGLVLTRMLGIGIVLYGVVVDNPILILATGWLFMLASFIGLSSAARLSRGSHAADYYRDSKQSNH